MNARLVSLMHLSAWAFGALGLGLAPGAARVRLPEVAIGPRPVEASERSAGTPDLETSIALGVFRADRVQPQVRYSAAAAERMADNEPAAPPPWTVTGILFAETPMALLDGIQGEASTRVVSVGEQIDGFGVRSIEPDRVVLVDGHTEWVLPLTVPWG